MSERCLTLGCPEAIRLSLQDPCTGERISGENSGAVVSCIRNWSLEAIVREGEAAEFVSDCGNIVARERQDDQLVGYTVSFETSVRSNEVEALVTGKELIVDEDDLSIGSYGIASSNSCQDGGADPRLLVEAFYKLSRCVTGADHVRFVMPMAQFKVTELDREGTITFFRYTAETGVMPVGALASGPFNDFPEDLVTFLEGQDPEELTTGFDFEEAITITGTCGTIEVPVPSCEFVVEDVASESPNAGITITGIDLDLVDGVSIDFYDAATGGSLVGGQQFLNPAGPNAGENITSGATIVTWDSTTITVYNDDPAFLSFDGSYARILYLSNEDATEGGPDPCTTTLELETGEIWVAENP